MDRKTKRKASVVFDVSSAVASPRASPTTQSPSGEFPASGHASLAASGANSGAAMAGPQPRGSAPPATLHLPPLPLAAAVPTTGAEFCATFLAALTASGAVDAADEAVGAGGGFGGSGGGAGGDTAPVPPLLLECLAQLRADAAVGVGGAVGGAVAAPRVPLPPAGRTNGAHAPPAASAALAQRRAAERSAAWHAFASRLALARGDTAGAVAFAEAALAMQQQQQKQPDGQGSKAPPAAELVPAQLALAWACLWHARRCEDTQLRAALEAKSLAAFDAALEAHWRAVGNTAALAKAFRDTGRRGGGASSAAAASAADGAVGGVVDVTDDGDGESEDEPDAAAAVATALPTPRSAAAASRAAATATAAAAAAAAASNADVEGPLLAVRAVFANAACGRLRRAVAIAEAALAPASAAAGATRHPPAPLLSALLGLLYSAGGRYDAAAAVLRRAVAGPGGGGGGSAAPAPDAPVEALLVLAAVLARWAGPSGGAAAAARRSEAVFCVATALQRLAALHADVFGESAAATVTGGGSPQPQPPSAAGARFVEPSWDCRALLARRVYRATALLLAVADAVAGPEPALGSEAASVAFPFEGAFAAAAATPEATAVDDAARGLADAALEFATRVAATAAPDVPPPTADVFRAVVAAEARRLCAQGNRSGARARLEAALGALGDDPGVLTALAAVVVDDAAAPAAAADGALEAAPQPRRVASAATALAAGLACASPFGGAATPVSVGRDALVLAASLLDTAVRLAPRDAGALHAAARCRALLGDTDAAVQLLLCAAGNEMAAPVLPFDALLPFIP